MARAASANAEEFITSSQKQVKITQILFFFKMANNKLNKNGIKSNFYLMYQKRKKENHSEDQT